MNVFSDALQVKPCMVKISHSVEVGCRRTVDADLDWSRSARLMRSAKSSKSLLLWN